MIQMGDPNRRKAIGLEGEKLGLASLLLIRDVKPLFYVCNFENGLARDVGNEGIPMSAEKIRL